MLSQHLPSTWTAAVLDGQGKLVARSRDPARFVGKSAVPALVDMARQYKEGTLETVTLEGIPVITAFSRSTVSHWTGVVGIPRDDLLGGLQRSLILLIAINVLLFSCALWLAWKLALSHVVRPTDQLLRRMRQISRDEDTGPTNAPAGSLELQALDEGLEEMRQRLRQRDLERQAVIQRLSTTLECISDGFYMLDPDWQFTYVNQHAEKLLRHDRDTLVGHDHWDILDPAESRPMRRAYEQAMRTHQATSFDIKLPSLGAWLEVNAYPSELGLAVYFRDITELRQARAAQAAQIAAEAASQAKNEFLSRMSHELRTPLNAVLGFAQVLRLDSVERLSDRQGAMVDRIESAGLHLLAMISDVLDLSRVEAGSMPLVLADVDVRQTANECCQMIDAQARAVDLTVTVQIGEDISVIHADKTRLKQVLLNLLSNAVKYNRPAGQVTLDIHRDGAQLRFSVRDTGLGLSPTQLQSLFEPFNRLGREQSSTPGTGIGLVISRKLVALMGGHLEVSSVEGQGSEFFFNLPL
jgi:PAS domain S-box-containing protein